MVAHWSSKPLVSVRIRLFAPKLIMWSQEIVDKLNLIQKSKSFHPYTCGTDDCGKLIECLNWENKPHTVFFRSELIATQNGWVCPNCDYTQDWY